MVLREEKINMHPFILVPHSSCLQTDGFPPGSARHGRRKARSRCGIGRGRAARRRPGWRTAASGGVCPAPEPPQSLTPSLYRAAADRARPIPDNPLCCMNVGSDRPCAASPPRTLRRVCGATQPAAWRNAPTPRQQGVDRREARAALPWARRAPAGRPWARQKSRGQSVFASGWCWGYAAGVVAQKCRLFFLFV